MDFLYEYTSPIILGICLCIGYTVKKWMTDVNNKFIPTIVAIFGVFLSLWINKWCITPEAILSGMISGLSSTGMHQLFTQFIEKDTQPKDTTT